MDAPGTRVGQKHPISVQGKAGWRKKMESRNGEVPSPLQVVTNINTTSLMATARSGEAAALDTERPTPR